MQVVMAVIAVSLVLLPGQVTEALAGGRSRTAWQTALSDSFAAAYSPTQVGYLLSNDSDVLRAGTIVVVQKDGLSGAWWVGGVGDNLVRDGSISPKGRQGLFDLEGPRRRSYKIGSRHYVRRVAVKDDEVQLSLATFDTYPVMEGNELKQRRFRAEVHFQFAPGQLDTMPYAEVRAAIDAVLAREQDLPIVKNVTLGQTTEEVEAILGRPERILATGTNVVYAYTRFKVILVDGKVADAE